VILSACNTAAGDQPGAEGLSGLAKAYFYAGSRALLVSHWPVVSDAAVRLSTGTLAAAAAEPGIGLAAALNRAMLALLDDRQNPHFAHPMFWAPFVVVGEGGSPVRAAVSGASLSTADARGVTGTTLGTRAPTRPALYITVKNANIRAGPSTKTARLTTLSKGTHLEVLERVGGGDWFRIARGGQEFGYVHGSLIEPVAP
jgi:uncharacterized protein YgiM (DUF1202 family)